jgi:hypothetical protein
MEMGFNISLYINVKNITVINVTVMEDRREVL